MPSLTPKTDDIFCRAEKTIKIVDGGTVIGNMSFLTVGAVLLGVVCWAPFPPSIRHDGFFPANLGDRIPRQDSCAMLPPERRDGPRGGQDDRISNKECSMRASTMRNGFLIGLTLAAGSVRADNMAVLPPAQPYCPPAWPAPNNLPWAAPGTIPGMPGTAAPGADAAAPAGDMLAERGGTGAAGTSIPTMYGDQLIGPNGNSSSSSRGTNVLSQIFRGGYNIADNESPRPMDRVYLDYNFYNNVLGSINSGSQFDVHRETFGIEKTFLGGDASIGLRLPILETHGSSSLEQAGVGDLTLIFKYAFYNNRQTGDVLSGGLALTVPSGRDFEPSSSPNARPVIFQPWTGSIMTFGDFYVQGFSSIAVPTDSVDSVVAYTDVGMGYFLYNDPCNGAFITAIIPTLECHYNAALNHRGVETDSLTGLDIVSFTGGATLGIRERSQLNIGVNVPVTGPKPYDIEALVQFNWKF
jgi:hypothetical protein